MIVFYVLCLLSLSHPMCLQLMVDEIMFSFALFVANRTNIPRAWRRVHIDDVLAEI